LSYELGSSKCGKKILKKLFIKRLAKGKKEKKHLMPSIGLEQNLLRREILCSATT
jgi:DNA-directed RNA polymerase subunit N (RpoN/RPB10)